MSVAASDADSSAEYWHDRLTFGFPSTSGRFEWDGGRRAVVDRTAVVVHDHDRPYRLVVSGSVYSSIYVVPSERLLAELVECANVRRPTGSGVLPATAHLALHRLAPRAARGDLDPLEIEETVVGVLRHVLTALDGGPAPQSIGPAQRDVIEATKLILGERLREPLTLRDVANQVFLSPFHLARLFRRATGMSIHEYRTRLRVSEGLAMLDDGRNIAAVAADLGFSSHAHFTARFTQVFGLPPSAVRRYSSSAGRPEHDERQRLHG